MPLGMAACWWLLSILGSSPNGAGTGGVVGIAFLQIASRNPSIVRRILPKVVADRLGRILVVGP